MSSVNDYLPVEIWLLIAEVNPTSFMAIRSVSREIRDYTNIHMDKYKDKFARKAEKEIGSYIEEYWELPNGDKHGLSLCWYSKDRTQFHEECTYKVGKLEGLYRVWYENADNIPEGQPQQLAIQCIYQNGEKEGLYQKWHRSNNLQVECTYKNGKKEGLYQSWYAGELNQRESLCTYKDGKMHGLFRGWHSTGQLACDCTWENGQKSGLYREWDLNGNICKQSIY